jgi:hypothetical protein
MASSHFAAEGTMTNKSYITVILILAISLLMLHMKSLGSDSAETDEISAYEYDQLEAAMNYYPEVAEATKELVKHDKVTIAEYNRIMRYSNEIKSRRTIKVSVLQVPNNEN